MKASLESLRAIRSEPRIGFDLLRIYLGVALFVRGALFVADPGRVLSFVVRSGDWFWPLLIAHYVGMAHLGGGILLTLGLATRLAAAIQVPILFGAVFLVHWHEGILSAGQGLELAGLVLVMLLAFSIFGAGPLSLDHRVRSHDSDAHSGPDVSGERPQESHS
jgi:uncharacterized membrane protein YphA (DoxX/SURF4 family)